jgi:hypothetical protein
MGVDSPTSPLEVQKYLGRRMAGKGIREVNQTDLIQYEDCLEQIAQHFVVKWAVSMVVQEIRLVWWLERWVLVPQVGDQYTASAGDNSVWVVQRQSLLVVKVVAGLVGKG